MTDDAEPYAAPGTVVAGGQPSWGYAWTVAAVGAVFGFLGSLVSASGEPTWLLVWPLLPVAAVVVERWRAGRRVRAEGGSGDRG